MTHVLYKCILKEHLFLNMQLNVELLVSGGTVSHEVRFAHYMPTLTCLYVFCSSSQMMINLRNLCIFLMNTLNPFTDDCFVTDMGKSDWKS